jgi:hypothetical protein
MTRSEDRADMLDPLPQYNPYYARSAVVAMRRGLNHIQRVFFSLLPAGHSRPPSWP